MRHKITLASITITLCLLPISYLSAGNDEEPSKAFLEFLASLDDEDGEWLDRSLVENNKQNTDMSGSTNKEKNYE